MFSRAKGITGQQVFVKRKRIKGGITEKDIRIDQWIKDTAILTVAPERTFWEKATDEAFARADLLKTVVDSFQFHKSRV